MQKWEYLSIYLKWEEWREERSKRQDWLLETDDDKQLTGMDEILNHFGEQGWELINLIPETAQGKLTHWASAEVKGFRCIFKRPIPT